MTISTPPRIRRAPLVPAPRRAVDRVSVLLVALAALLWASDVFFRAGLLDGASGPALSAGQLVFAEDLLITLAFLPVASRVWREARRLPRRAWIAVLLIAAGPQAAATVLFTESVRLSFASGASSETYLLQQLQPLIAVALAWWVLGERRRASFWPLAGLALVAVYMVVFGEGSLLQPLDDVRNHGRLNAGLLALGAAALWAFGTVLGRYVLRGLSFVTTTALRFALALPVLLLILLARDGGGALGGYSASHVPRLLGIAVVPGLVALLLYYRALRSTPASLATLAETAYPVAVTLLLALPAPYGFSAAIHPVQLLGSALLVLVMLALNAGKEQAMATPPPRAEPELQLALDG